MSKIFLQSLSILFVVFGVSAFAAEHPELKAFPEANAGMERFVIVLPEKKGTQESAFKVEIVAGKEMLTDGVNLFRLGNAIEARTLEGWGYTYYEVTGSQQTMSTMMAVPEKSLKVKQFVAAPSILVQYNSRLPIVVYAPEGFKVKYRIWTTPVTMQDAENK